MTSPATAQILPLALTTLEFVPVELRQHYGPRDYEGNYPLVTLPSGDYSKHPAHHAAIVAREVEVLLEGETPSSRAEAKRVDDVARAAFMQTVADNQQAEDDKRAAEFRAKQAKDLAAFQAEQARFRKSYQMP
jgi:hypothetical protein